MVLLRVGDLVRWKSSLFLVENGVEVDIGRWHHALILSITTQKHMLTKTEYTEANRIRLMLIGPDHAARQIEMTVEALYDMGDLEKITGSAWVNAGKL